MSFLFDTDAISEILRPKPAAKYIQWLLSIPCEEQFTSAVVIGELYKGAYRSKAREHHLKNIEQRVITAVIVLPYDVKSGDILPDADIQIAATAIYHDLELVTGNLRHFSRIDSLKINTIFSSLRFAR